MLEYKIASLGPQRRRLPWATQHVTNDGRSFALPITAKKSFCKGTCQRGCLGPDSKNHHIHFIHIIFLRNQTKKCTIKPKSYTAMLLTFVFDS